MPGRSYSSGAYRYGFNGKEKDKDLNSLTAYDYGFRIYNPGIGKFLSVDPLAGSYPWYTPYQFAGNGPIENIDLEGAEPEKATTIEFNRPKAPPIRIWIDENIRKEALSLAQSNGGGLDISGAKKENRAWVKRILSGGSKLFGTLGAVLTPMSDRGCGGCLTPRSYTPNQTPSTQPQPQPQLTPPDPRTVTPPDKEGEMGAHLYKTVENQKIPELGG